MDQVSGKADDGLAVGQAWEAVSDRRQIELITRNATGETIIGYQADHGTSLVTEAEFVEWVQDEAALKADGDPS